MTPTFVEQILNQFNDDGILVLIIIEHPDLEETLRFVSSNLPVMSNGFEFLAFPCAISLPTDSDQVPNATLTISNVDRRIGEGLESLETPAIITFQMVLASDPDTIEREWPQMQLVDATWTNLSIRGTLSQDVYWNEPYGRKRVTPLKFPGLFA